jgi:hypothetical protein
MSKNIEAGIAKLLHRKTGRAGRQRIAKEDSLHLAK